MPAEGTEVRPAGEAARPRGDWLRAFAVYGDRRVLIIFFMGFASGLPLLLTLSTLSYRLEEHTSELQSLMRISYAVFCLKKKNNNNITIHTRTNYYYENIHM